MSEAESEWVGLIWLTGKPLVPGVSCCWLGGRLVSSGAAEKWQSTQRADLRSYGNKINSQWAEASYRRYTLKTWSHLRAKGNQLRVTHQKKYSWAGSLKNVHVRCEVAFRHLCHGINSSVVEEAFGTNSTLKKSSTTSQSPAFTSINQSR